MIIFDTTTHPHIALITIDRPEKYNAMTPDMAQQLIEAVTAIDADDNIRVAVITGTGAKAFCCGSDIETLDDYATPWEFRNRTDYCDALRAMRKPIIAAVNGYALGGGLELTLICDIRIAAANAKFGAPEIKLGWVGGGGMVPFLMNSVGQSNAATMIFTGDPITAEKALAWGLISQVVEPDALMDSALELAATIAARAPIAAQCGKAYLRAAQSMPLEDAIRYERDLQAVCMATEDATEGRTAFKEKRAAKFVGR
ncbi:MAG: enoyl-CoA hydratase/isomerase family protein [Rhodospirillales bacterium]|jgi:enoyl-CoA hydratase/carnithine racemase|nr:enoyl-CoA hydratase/isomerase family protein [Rhodospirillales bacterium]